MLRSHQATSQDTQRSGLEHQIYLPEKPNKSCLLLVHGRAGSANVMWIFTKALGQSRPTIIAPQAYIEDEIGGYSWWKIGSSDPGNKTRKIEQSYLNDPVNRLHNFILTLPELYGVDLNNLVAFGFSQGAGILAALSVRQPKLFKGIGLLSGFLPSPARYELENNPSLVLPKIFMFHGTADETIKFARAKEDSEVLARFSSQLILEQDNVAHKVSSLGIRSLESWLSQFNL